MTTVEIMGFDDSGSWVLTTVEIGVGFDDESVNGFFFFSLLLLLFRRSGLIWMMEDKGMELCGRR